MPAQGVEAEKMQKKHAQKDASVVASGSTNSRSEEEKEKFSWEAPARPFKRRNREFFITIIAMAAIVALVMFFAEGFMPVLLIVAIVFLYYTLSTVEPEKISYNITNLGIRVADRRLDWEIINKYWFSKKLDTQVMVLELGIIPGRIDLVINQDDKDGIRKAIEGHAPENETPPSHIDKAIDWFSSKLPGS